MTDAHLTADEVADGKGLTLTQAAGLFPPIRQGKPVHPATVSRWAMAGIRTADGRTMRLGAARVGGRWLTSRAAVARFVREQQPQADVAERPRPKSSNREVAVERELAAMGV